MIPLIVPSNCWLKFDLTNIDFKLLIKGVLSPKLLNSFVSLDVIRDGNSLKLLNYEVIEKNLSKTN